MEGYDPTKAGSQTITLIYKKNKNLNLTDTIEVIEQNLETTAEPEAVQVKKPSETGSSENRKSKNEMENPDTADQGIRASAGILLVSAVVLSGGLIMRFRK